MRELYVKLFEDFKGYLSAEELTTFNERFKRNFELTDYDLSLLEEKG